MEPGNSQHLKLAAALLIASIGMILAGHAVWRLSSGGGRPSVVQPSGPRPEPLPIAQTLESHFDGANAIHADDAEDLARSIASAARRGLARLPAHERPVHADIDALADEIGEIFAIYLTGDYDRYLSYAQTRGADLRALQSEEHCKQGRSYFESSVSTVKLRPVSLDELVVRTRYLRGLEIEHEPLGALGTVAAPERYALPQNPERAGLTIYETAVPVSYTWDKQTSPMFIAIWHAWSSDRERWLPWRLVMYDPTMNATIVPPPHP